MTADLAFQFWQDACALYKRTYVKEICLELQDGEFAFNVNVLLFMGWLDRRGQTLSPDEIRMLNSAIQLWHDSVVTPLRTIRRKIKDQQSKCELYCQIVRVELLAEQREQELMLASSQVAPPMTPNVKGGNLMAYAHVLAADNCAKTMELLDRLWANLRE